MNGSIVTVVIPCSPNHEQFISAAIASVQAQTIPAEINVYIDKHERGAGYARNAGAANVDTPFVVFLDADDTLEPTFLEHCLMAYQQGHYVYTGWYSGGRPFMPAERTPYRGEGYHLVTTLIPTKAFKAVGGFDESLPGHEDADLHFKLMAVGICGNRVAEYLVNYSHHGTRGNAFRARSDYEFIREQVFKRNGGELTTMCCGVPDAPGQPSPMGEKHEGDVEAIALWSGIHTERSWFSDTRVYRGGNMSRLWVDPRDVAAQPKLFRRLFPELTPSREDVLKESGLI
jgi:hypothetical protein